MDREKVIKGLEMCIRHGENPSVRCGQKDECPYEQNGLPCWIDLSKDALALLKEQEAVEPIPFFTTTGEESRNYVVCGHCKSINSIMPKATKQKYCHECGRPVLWKGR